MTRLMPFPSDGRQFTTYMSAGQREELQQQKYGVFSEHEYRAFLQHNADRVAREMHQWFMSPAPVRPAKKYF